MPTLLNPKTRQVKIIIGLTALLIFCCGCNILAMLVSPSWLNRAERAAPVAQIEVSPAALQPAPTATPLPTPTLTPSLASPMATAEPTATSTQVVPPTEAPAGKANAQAQPLPPPTWQPTATPALAADSQVSLPTGLQQAQVINVVDGDTIDVLIDGVEYRVRYILVDTPETKHPTRGVEPFGPEAYEFNKSMVESQVVGLEKDVSETDRYGRLLRYVYLGELMVNEELLRQGLAQVSTYPPDVKYVERFLAVQGKAQAAGVGIWSGEPAIEATPVMEPTIPPRATVAPVEPAPAGGGVVIRTIFYDGAVKQVESDEYIEIANQGSEAVDMTGWRIYAGAPGQEFYFPQGFVMQPAQSCRVYTNEVHPETCGLSFGSGQAIWNNKGDTGQLYNAQGQVVSEWSY